MVRNLVVFAAALAVAGIAFSAPDPAIQAIANQVSQAQYTAYHLAVESMGLGLYGGPSYNMGYRNRDSTGAGSLGNQETRLYLTQTFAAMGLTVSVQGSYSNVIGELPGRTNPARILVIGGHYDHIPGDRPGGDDNASGTAGVLEAARVLSRYQFESTIRFIGFNAEERGLLGSADYVNNHVKPNGENIVAMLNMDMILRPGWDNNPNAVIDLDVGTRTSHAPSVALASAFRQAASDYTPTLTVDSTTFNITGGSDQDPFVAAGYPAILLIENTATEIWSGANAYYHTDNDASDRLANSASNPSGVVYDYSFATGVVRAVVALAAAQAVLIPEPGSAAILIFGLAYVAWWRRRPRRRR